MWTIYDGDSQHRHPQTRQRQAPHQQHPQHPHPRPHTGTKHHETPRRHHVPGSPEFRQFLAAMLRFGASSSAKIRFVDVMPFIATWKYEPSCRSGMKKSAASRIVSNTAAIGAKAQAAARRTARKRQTARASRESPYRNADAGGRATVCHGIHRRERTQLDLQHVHGHHAELFGLLVHDSCGALVRIEGFQRFKSLQIVEERGAHIGVFAPVFLEYAGGTHRHHADDEHDERRAGEQRRGGGQVDRRNTANSVMGASMA